MHGVARAGLVREVPQVRATTVPGHLVLPVGRGELGERPATAVDHAGADEVVAHGRISLLGGLVLRRSGGNLRIVLAGTR